MNRGRIQPASPDSWAWCEACADRLQERETRLATADADALAARLWADETVRGACPLQTADDYLAG